MANKKQVALNLTGKYFNRLKVIGLSHAIKRKDSNKLRRYWKCVCECGNTCIVEGSQLTTGHTKSCGCLHREGLIQRNTTHGQSYTREYTTWGGMIARCSNSKNPHYKYYGGDGIIVCDRWKIFENFYQDMGNCPGPEYSIDRIDNDGIYEPSNCRWATHTEQMRNTRRNVLDMESVRKIRTMRNSQQYTLCEIANLFQCSVSAISHVLANRTWKENNERG